MTDPNPWEPLARKPLPGDVARAREDFTQANDANCAVLAPLIELHLGCYDVALTELEGAHRLIADETELDLKGKTRPAAMWLVLGRCLGLARAGLDLVALGYAGEMAPTLRSLHEASQLLGVIALPGEDALLKKWLDGKYVSRGEVMAASDRQQETGRVSMLKQGLPPAGKTGSHFQGQWGRWSEFAHHRRRHLVDQVSGEGRLMAFGIHPDWRARAASVDLFGWYVAELVSIGGSALGHLLGVEWAQTRFQPTFHKLIELKARVPLDDLARGKVGVATKAP